MNVEESALDRYGCELNNFSHASGGDEYISGSLLGLLVKRGTLRVKMVKVWFK